MLGEPEARVDVWVLGVGGDPRAAVATLAGALADVNKAQTVLRAMPAMALINVTRAEADAFVAAVAPEGIETDIRKTRRARPVAPPPSTSVITPAAAPTEDVAPTERAAPAPTPSPAVLAPPPQLPPAEAFALGAQGEQMVSFPAALVASMAYPLQLRLLPALVAVAMAVVASLVLGTLPLITAQIMAFGLATGAPLTLFAIVVRHSYCGADRFGLRDLQTDFKGILFMGVRFTIVTWAALAPAAAAFDVGGPVGIALAVILLMIAIFILPGAYAAAAVGDGCSGLNPISGAMLAFRLPGAYLLTLVYLYAFMTLTNGLLVVVFLLSTLLDPGMMVVAAFGLIMLCLLPLCVSGRALGLLMYHHGAELGL